jgi:hypothetical protein
LIDVEKDFSQAEGMCRRILKVYSEIEVKMAKEPDYWDSLADLSFSRLQLIDKKFILQEKKRAADAQVEDNPDSKVKFAVAPTSTLQERAEKVKEEKRQILESIAEYYLKACHANMIVGWEVEKPRCEKLIVLAEKFIDIERKVRLSIDHHHKSFAHCS